VCVDFIQATNISMIRGKDKKGFIDGWGTPNICLANGRKSQKFYVSINLEYKIYQG